MLEEGANVQDTCVMHGFPGTDTVVERDGHIGHGAVLHGCRIGRNALVGTAADVAARIRELATRLGVDEVAIVTWAHDERARHTSYELLAKEFALTSQAGG